MARVRIYELAKEFDLPNKELVAKVRGMGIDVRNHMSAVDTDDVQRIKRHLEKERVENREVERLSSTVIRRRSRAAKPMPKGVTREVAPSPAVATMSPMSPMSPPAIVEREPAAPEPAGGAGVEEMAEAPAVPPAPAQAVEAKAEVATEDPATEVPPLESSIPEADNTPEPPAEEPRPVEAKTPAAPVEQPGPLEVPQFSDEQSASMESSEEMVGETQTESKTKTTVRYAPGFEPGGKYSQRPPDRYGRPAAPGGGAVQANGSGALPATSAGEPPQLSAAEAARMMTPAKPKVVITDLDARRGVRREVSRADLFKDRRFRQQQQRARRKKPQTTKKGKKTEITTPAEHKRVIRVEEAIGVGEIARQMGAKATDVLKKLWGMGLTNITINQSIDADTAAILATEFGYEVEDIAFREEQVLQDTADKPEDLKPRAPVITVMGHVDHGKTSLLDAMRDTRVASGEAGGITQHIGAYRVPTPQGELVFLDTPGHEAFTAMRARGAHCTDIVVLVVAADDGVMPQTIEAMDHAKDAEVPIIVAVNKCDLTDANPDRVKTELAERGLLPEAWGGETIYVEVSAKTKDGIDSLLESLSLQAELLELQANPEKAAKGIVIEAKLDRARGAMCTVLVQEGTLHVGDTVVTGEHVGKVRAMLDDRGKQVEAAGPSTPVEILGLGGVPNAGDLFNAVTDEKVARQVAEHRHNQTRQRELAGATTSKTYEEILGELKSGAARELKALVKADVQGSAEALKESLHKLGTPKVSVNVISAGVGGIHETDVNLAKAAGAVILGFNVRPAGKASQLAEREHVEIQIYDVIYELLDDVKTLMQGLLPKERRERLMGRAEVRETFSIPRIGIIAGCAVVDGKVSRSAHLRLIRDNVKIYDGRVGSLKRFKDDVREVEKGYECGMSVDGYNDIKVGDVIEAYEIEEVAASLT